MENNTDNLLLYWHDCAQRHMERQWLFSRDHQGQWHGTSYRDAIKEITKLAGTLGSLGLTEDEPVILLGENSPEWVIGNFSILAAGGIAVPSYTTYTSADYKHLLGDCGARMAIIETPDLAHRLLAGKSNLQKIILMSGGEDWQDFKKKHAGIECYLWHDLMEQAEIKKWHDLPGTNAAADKTAAIIYTSGTTSHALGVELSHKALLANMRGCQNAVNKISFIGREVFLSFLPLSHAYEYMCGQFLTSSMGAEVYFTSVEFLRRDLAETHPTIMTAVPRLYEAFYASIQGMLNKASPMRKYLFQKTYELGKKQYLNPEKFTISDRLVNLLLGVLVRKKIKKFLGGKLKAFVSGGAALNPDIALFFTAFDVLILQGYGLTEASPVVSVNLPRSHNKPDDIYGVGFPLTGVAVKIADDGEILIKGDTLMNGYWNDPERTAETIKNGWLYTGDVGYLDDKGRLHITDRKKDIIVTVGGDNISPQKIENLLSVQESIQQAVVYVDNKNHKKTHLHALIVPQGKADEEAIKQAVESANQQLSAVEKIQHWHIAEEEFSIENGLMTPSMKLKRRKILQKYGLQ